MRESDNDIGILTVTWNEAWNIGTVVQQAQRYGDVLVMDGASTDNTIHQAREAGARVMFYERDPGLAQCTVAGFRWLVGHGYKRIVQLDAGLSFSPLEIPRLLEHDGADLVLGQRPGDSRRPVSKAGSWLARRWLGLPYRDVTCGFRCWSASALRQMDTEGVFDNLRCRMHGFQIELLYEALWRGFLITPVDVTYAPGRSSGHWNVALEALQAVWAMREG